MKKNAMLKIAAILMVAVLLTTCAISSTFAKYTTGDSKNATARVSKWGVNAELSMAGIFGTTYGSDAGSGSVTSSTTENVIAPGTYDEIVVTSQVTGTPEVSVKVTYTANLTLSGFEAYFPLRFYINDKMIVDSEGKPAGVDAVETAIEEAFTKQSAEYGPNTNLASKTNDVKITWEWIFDSGNDVKDTALGDTAATGTAASVTLEVGVQVDQTGPAAVKPAPVVDGE